jgi:hypothetical protein
MISEEAIEARTKLVRKKLEIEHTFAFDVHAALETLRKVAKNFSFRSGSVDELGTDEAIMDYESDTLIAHDTIFSDLKAGRVRARFTIAHELGHFFLGHEGRRARNKDKSVYSSALQKIAETEANIFASYLLVPTDLAMNATTAEEIASRFQVSIEAAEIAFERVQAAKRRLLGKKRKSPAVVINFLEELRKRGYTINSIPDPDSYD